MNDEQNVGLFDKQHYEDLIALNDWFDQLKEALELPWEAEKEDVLEAVQYLVSSTKES